MKSRASILPSVFEELRADARRIAFRCGSGGAPIGAPPPFFFGGRIFFGVVFGGVNQSSDAKAHRENDYARHCRA